MSDNEQQLPTRPEKFFEVAMIMTETWGGADLGDLAQICSVLRGAAPLAVIRMPQEMLEQLAMRITFMHDALARRTRKRKARSVQFAGVAGLLSAMAVGAWALGPSSLLNIAVGGSVALLFVGVAFVALGSQSEEQDYHPEVLVPLDELRTKINDELVTRERERLKATPYRTRVSVPPTQSAEPEDVTESANSAKKDTNHDH